jgi:adenosylcobinamide-GDP ribazoletransferase
MTPAWRQFSSAWGTFTRMPRLLPLVGVVVGITGGAVYWLAAQAWPSSIAVILSMLATVLMTGGIHEEGFAELCAALRLTRTPPAAIAGARARGDGLAVLGIVFVLLIKYSALTALTAANLPFVLPANVALGLIMVAGHAVSRALLLSVSAGPGGSESRRLSSGELAFVLLSGFAPAALLGTPGLIGLAAAIVLRLAAAATIKHRLGGLTENGQDAVQQIAEAGFYLGALAAWTYI